MIWHLLTAILVVLKLTGYISAPWLVVLCPTLISLAVGLLFMLIGLFIVHKAKDLR